MVSPGVTAPLKNIARDIPASGIAASVGLASSTALLFDEPSITSLMMRSVAVDAAATAGSAGTARPTAASAAETTVTVRRRTTRCMAAPCSTPGAATPGSRSDYGSGRIRRKVRRAKFR